MSYDIKSPREITAQPRQVEDSAPEVSIQALAMFPDLLPRTYAPKKRSRDKKHEDCCECDKCENGEEYRELDF